MTILVTKVISLQDKTTSMRLAQAEWAAIELICERENIKRNLLITLISHNRDKQMALTSSVRLFITVYLYQLQKEKETPNYSSSKDMNSSPIFKAIKSIL